jgi:hypothetical protein
MELMNQVDLDHEKKTAEKKYHATVPLRNMHYLLNRNVLKNIYIGDISPSALFLIYE